MTTKQATKPALPTGAVAKEITKLLTGRKTPLSYQAIADRVRAKLPEAHTTDRSVASIASALRKQGMELPDRRRATG
jgi:predicted Zn-ribbon and HTH transcriptional regulator